MIDIKVVDIPEAHGVILSKDWSTNLNKYFAIDWSHLWLPYKGQSNKIKVEQERYMKHTVTDLNDLNEMVIFSRSILGNFFFETFFGEFKDEISPLVDSYKQSELLHSNQIVVLNYTLVDYSNDESVDSSHCLLSRLLSRSHF